MSAECFSPEDLHALRNKLSVIIGRCDLLRERFPDDLSLLKPISEIQQAAKWMADELQKHNKKAAKSAAQ